MSEFDDARLIEAMRAFLRATEALDAAASSASTDDSRDVIEKADAKTLAAMTLRKHLETAGWTGPRRVAADNAAGGDR